MKKTQCILMAIFCAILIAAAALYASGEFLQADMTIFDSATRQQQFVCKTLMIMLTIGLLPLSLRLFKLRRVAAHLQQQGAPALLRWGILRLALMGLLLVGNTFLYYAFAFESTYGYLAVVTLLTMPFVIPTKGRCKEETESRVDSSELSDDSSELSGDSSELSDDSSELSDDSSELSDDSSELSDDSSELSDVSSELSDDSSELSDESSELSDESSELSNNSSELSDVSSSATKEKSLNSQPSTLNSKH